jgi:hypothetical protein
MSEIETNNVSETQESNVTTETNNDKSEVKETTETVKTETKQEGWDQVDFTPEQQKRFDKVYRDLKTYQKETYELRDIAKQQSDLINQLSVGQTQIISHLQNDDFSKAESSLKIQRKEAYDRGDLSTVDDINDKLSDLKIQKKLSDLETKKQTIQQNMQPKQSSGGDDIVSRAASSGYITTDDAAVYRAWANETDEYGNLKRPWVNQNDHRNMAAAVEGRAVFTNPNYANKAFVDKLNEIDKRMGVVNKQSSSNVLSGGNLTIGTKSSTVKLTPYQERVAIKTQFAGKGKSSQEHIEAWKKQLTEQKGVK